MIRAFGFLYIESKTEWDKEYDKEIGRIQRNTVHEEPTQFPACFKLEESWDAHFCGTWRPCDKKEMIRAFEKDIAETQKILNIIKGA